MNLISTNCLTAQSYLNNSCILQEEFWPPNASSGEDPTTPMGQLWICSSDIAGASLCEPVKTVGRG